MLNVAMMRVIVLNAIRKNWQGLVALYTKVELPQGNAISQNWLV
jgi:hypothetical protein